MCVRMWTWRVCVHLCTCLYWCGACVWPQCATGIQSRGSACTSLDRWVVGTAPPVLCTGTFAAKPDTNSSRKRQQAYDCKSRTEEMYKWVQPHCNHTPVPMIEANNVLLAGNRNTSACSSFHPVSSWSVAEIGQHAVSTQKMHLISGSAGTSEVWGCGQCMLWGSQMEVIALIPPPPTPPSPHHHTTINTTKTLDSSRKSEVACKIHKCPRVFNSPINMNQALMLHEPKSKARTKYDRSKYSGMLNKSYAKGEEGKPAPCANLSCLPLGKAENAVLLAP